LVYVVAEVLRRRQFEDLGVECRHVGLYVVKEECLKQMTSIDSDWNLFKKL
jgi:hypothetical protein